MGFDEGITAGCPKKKHPMSIPHRMIKEKENLYCILQRFYF